MIVYEGAAKLLPTEQRFDVSIHPTKEQIRTIFIEVIQQNRDAMKSVITERFLHDLWLFLNPVKDPWDGNGLSKTECEQGQVVPGFCSTCRKSPDKFCGVLVKERALKIRRRNIHGVLLPIDKGERFPVAALQWSTVYETAYRVIEKHSCVICAGCEKKIIDGMPNVGLSVRRVRSQIKVGKDKKPIPYPDRWTESKSVYTCCDEECKKMAIEKKAIFACRGCGRLAHADTKTLQSTKLCYRCIKRFILTNGLDDHPLGQLDKEAIWSFSSRVISQREGREAGFRQLKLKDQAGSNKYVTFPTIDGATLIRETDHKRMAERPGLLGRFLRRKKSPG